MGRSRQWMWRLAWSVSFVLFLLGAGRSIRDIWAEDRLWRNNTYSDFGASSSISTPSFLITARAQRVAFYWWDLSEQGSPSRVDWSFESFPAGTTKKDVIKWWLRPYAATTNLAGETKPIGTVYSGAFAGIGYNWAKLDLKSRNDFTVVYFPMWLAFVPLCVTAVVWWKIYRRFGPRQCTKCGYDLRASPDRCPECGAMVVGVGSAGA